MEKMPSFEAEETNVNDRNTDMLDAISLINNNPYGEGIAKAVEEYAGKYSGVEVTPDNLNELSVAAFNAYEASLERDEGEGRAIDAAFDAIKK
jgi:hypothetical protein